jgi:hypothetical protein
MRVKFEERWETVEVRRGEERACGEAHRYMIEIGKALTNAKASTIFSAV